MESNLETLPSGYVLIDFKEPDTVIFETVGTINTEHWLELVNWWNNGGFVDPQSVTFTTTLDDYLAKRTWLKDNWRLKGREVKISKKLKLVVTESASEKKQFRELASNPKPIPISGINLKKIKREL